MATRSILLAACLTLFGQSVWAQATTMTGNELIRLCNGRGIDSQLALCIGYIHGFLGANEIGTIRIVDFYWRNRLGYVHGKLDKEKLVSAAKQWRGYCIPEEATVEQLKDVIVEYLTSHASVRHERAAFLVFGALLEAYPCHDISQSISESKQPEENVLIGSYQVERSWKHKDWEVTAHDSFVKYSSHGRNIYGHEFGFFKTKGRCSNDIFLLTWTTQDSEISALKGEDVSLMAQIGEIEARLVVPMSFSFRFLKNLYVIYFTNFIVSKDFVSLLDAGEDIRVTITAPDKVVTKLDIVEDEFSLAGFIATRMKAKEYCEGLE